MPHDKMSTAQQMYKEAAPQQHFLTGLIQATTANTPASPLYENNFMQRRETNRLGVRIIKCKFKQEFIPQLVRFNLMQTARAHSGPPGHLAGSTAAAWGF